MRTPTVENYLRVIYELGEEAGKPTVSTGAVAKQLKIAQATATVAFQRLASDGYVKYVAYRGAELTREGRGVALQTLRSHRLIELFLHRSLNLTWAETHEQSQYIEHSVSPWLLEKIDSYLDCPRFGIHGDPIPSAEGRLPENDVSSLAELPPGASFTLCRIIGRTPNFLRHIQELGFAVGVCGTVCDRLDESGPMTICMGGVRRELCRHVAEKLLVRSEAGRA